MLSYGMFHCSWLFLVQSGLAQHTRLARRTTSRDILTDNYVKFQSVQVNRNLRGLFPIEEDEISAPEVSNRDGGGSNLQLVGSGGQTAYITEVRFGDKGPFWAVIDTGSSDSWLISSLFHCLDDSLQEITQEQCRLEPRYSASSTFKQDMNAHFAIQYGDGEKLLGAVGTEDVTIGGITVHDQRVNIVDRAAWKGDRISSGLIGLGFPSLTAQYEGNIETDVSRPLVYDPFFTSAVKTGAVSANTFAIALQRDAKEGGYLSFGGIPPVKTYGETVMAPFAAPRSSAKGRSEYTIDIDGFKFGSNGKASQSAQGASEALIDSGTSVLLAPAAVARAYNALWNPRTQDPPAFSVIIGGVEFPIDPSDLKIVTNGRATSAIVGSRKTILGDTFMRNVMSIFDIGASQMRFVSTNPTAGPETSAPNQQKREVSAASLLLDSLRKSDIIPTVLPEFAESLRFEVRFGTKVINGQELSKTETAQAPRITIEGTGKYTIVCLDPDAPRNAGQGVKQSAFLHAIATGVAAGNDMDYAELTRNGVVYRGPGPPPLTGLHRYIFVALLEPDGSNLNVASTSRRSFKIEEFMASQQLKLASAAYMVVQNTFGSQPSTFVVPRTP